MPGREKEARFAVRNFAEKFSRHSATLGKTRGSASGKDLLRWN